MPTGPGKYDDLCTELREKTKAKSVIIAVFDGTKGSGFSCQADLTITLKLPKILRDIADEIERSGL